MVTQIAVASSEKTMPALRPAAQVTITIGTRYTIASRSSCPSPYSTSAIIPIRASASANTAPVGCLPTVLLSHATNMLPLRHASAASRTGGTAPRQGLPGARRRGVMMT